MFNELKELVESGTISEEVATKIHEAYYTPLQKANEEAAKYRVAKKELENELKSKYEEQINALTAQIEEAKEAGKAEVASEYESKLSELSKQREELAKRAKNAVIDATLKDAIGQYDWTARGAAELLVKQYLTYDDENDAVYVELDGQRLDPKDGVAKLFDTVPDLKAILKSKGNGGSGAGTGGSGTPNIDPSKMKPEEKAAFIREHGSEAYLKMVSQTLQKD